MQISPHAPDKQVYMPLEHMFNASGEYSFRFLKAVETALQVSEELFQVKHSRHSTEQDRVSQWLCPQAFQCPQAGLRDHGLGTGGLGPVLRLLL